MEITGKLKLINETQTFGNNGFRKREVVVTTDEQYAQMILIEFVQDKVELLDNFKVGQDIKIHFNLRGREWINPEGVAKYFNAIQGWRIESINSDLQESTIEPIQEISTKTFITEEVDDGLPF